MALNAVGVVREARVHECELRTSGVVFGYHDLALLFELRFRDLEFHHVSLYMRVHISAGQKRKEAE